MGGSRTKRKGKEERVRAEEVAASLLEVPGLFVLCGAAAGGGGNGGGCMTAVGVVSRRRGRRKRQDAAAA